MFGCVRQDDAANYWILYAAAFSDERVIKNGARFKAKPKVEIELNLRWKWSCSRLK